MSNHVYNKFVIYKENITNITKGIRNGKMEREIREFIAFMHNTRRTSYNTEVSYQRDLKKVSAFLKERGIEEFAKADEQDLQDYMRYMERENFASSTISRSIASLRALYHFLQREGRIRKDPSESLRAPKVEKKTPEILSVQEVTRLLEQPDKNTPKGLRDSAMLELLYATGMRVSELIHLELDDVNLRLSYVTCHEGTRERVIPIGKVSRDVLELYLRESRPVFVKSSDEKMLLTNCSGTAMSRQGFWKVLKSYADEAGVSHDITPHTLRHSFAVHMLQNGADVRSVQEMLGHSDISTTQVYLNMNMVRMRDVYMNAHPRS